MSGLICGNNGLRKEMRAGNVQVCLAFVVVACGGKSAEISKQATAAAADTAPVTGSQCPGVIEIQRAYVDETKRLKPLDEQEQIENPIAQNGPCSECISACSAMRHAGCQAQDDCIERNCDCATTGCPNGISEDDFCSCATTCVGSNQKVCLQPWIQFGQCLIDACAGVCP